MHFLTIIGAGLAGCEAAWQAAQAGVNVHLYEMRPHKMTGAHQSGNFAELVCSNSLGSASVENATGLLLSELEEKNSLLIQCAKKAGVPAGKALAVDREIFSKEVMASLENHPHIKIIREEVTTIPETPTILASGPLTSPSLSKSIEEFTGADHLYFFDALSPIVTKSSINFEKAFWGSRYNKSQKEGGDYINCPFTKEEFQIFVKELVNAERISLAGFEENIQKGVKAGLGKFFEGCLPVEILAQRSERALTFGPMKPVGLDDPKTGRWPYAVVQLRQDNVAATLFNLVGFQTNLKFQEQERVFRLIPGLENAEFVRFGQMHRNTFVCSPLVLNATLQTKKRNDLFLAGQITGVEGYAGNIATGLLAGINAAKFLKTEELLTLPATTMLGALCNYITNADAKHFQPMKANFGILKK